MKNKDFIKSWLFYDYFNDFKKTKTIITYDLTPVTSGLFVFLIILGLSDSIQNFIFITTPSLCFKLLIILCFITLFYTILIVIYNKINKTPSYLFIILSKILYDSFSIYTFFGIVMSKLNSLTNILARSFIFKTFTVIIVLCISIILSKIIKAILFNLLNKYYRKENYS